MESERCPSCGFTEDQAQVVRAELVDCPTCKDRDLQLLAMRKAEGDHPGVRVGWEHLTDEWDVNVWSAARHTKAGAERRARYLRENR